MTFKKTVAGVIFSFFMVGTVATSAYESGYQEIYNQQEEQEKLVNTALQSEFISAQDKKQLEDNLSSFEKAEKNENKQALNKRLTAQKNELEVVEERLVVEEKKTAKEEYKALTKDIKALETKSKEAFVRLEDEEEVESLKEEIAQLSSVEEVKPVRDIAVTLPELSKELANNQAETIQVVDELKKESKEVEALAANQYVLADDKKALEDNIKASSSFFKDADNFEKLQSHRKEFKLVVEEVKQRIKETETDFKQFGPKTNELVKKVDDLLAKESLTADEKEALTKEAKKVKAALEKKGYQPGDLKQLNEQLSQTYQQYEKVSQERLEEARKKAEAAAKKQQQEEARLQQEAQAASSQQASNQSGVTDSSGWTHAPAGSKYLSKSGKTYNQVKNPGNFSLITEAEAANYSPGHGNGSAKQ